MSYTTNINHHSTPTQRTLLACAWHQITAFFTNLVRLQDDADGNLDIELREIEAGGSVAINGVTDVERGGYGKRRGAGRIIWVDEFGERWEAIVV